MRRDIYTDTSGVSSVISVILMVAVTVILAAVVATFALGFAESTDDVAPQASFDIEQQTQVVDANGQHYAEFYTVEITYTGGDRLDQGDISVQINGAQAWGVQTDDCGTDCDSATALWDGSSAVQGGSSVTVVHGDDPALSEDGEYSVYTNDGSTPEGGSDDISANILVPTGYGPADTDRFIDLDVGDTVRVVWEGDGSSETAVLAEHEITE